MSSAKDSLDDVGGGEATLHSSFYALPGEILCIIFQKVAEDVYYNCDTIPSLTAKNAEDNLIEGQRTLCALSLTCRRFYVIVQPILYRTIVFPPCYPDKHQLLLRSITQAPSTAQHVTQLIFFEGLLSGPEVTMPADSESDDTYPRDHTNLIKLLRFLPQLRQFWYVPFEDQSAAHSGRNDYHPYTDMGMRPRSYPLFFTFMAAVNRTNEPGLFDWLNGRLEDIYLHGFLESAFMVFLGMILALPTLHTLRLSHWPSFSLFPGVSRAWNASNVRRLFLSCRANDIDDIPEILTAVKALEVLHLEVDASISTFYGQFVNLQDLFQSESWSSAGPRPVLDALAQHHKTLKDLRIVGPHPMGSLANLDLSPFENLAVIDLPDCLLFDSLTTIHDLIPRLPSALGILTVDISSASALTCIMMGHLASHADYFPSLKKVALTNRGDRTLQLVGQDTPSQLEVELAIAEKKFADHAVVYEYPDRLKCRVQQWVRMEIRVISSRRVGRINPGVFDDA
ncbi:uncharacterized protein DSM5745_03741 [Aspergillus mulundensis]|uniref:Uncharacterized protein n=1 Tax=Aspergillus mulundensis TaxID=1810919 RepID=A0A3D8SL90_9EURO|nr:hypothetical protein DSM5745_03741 [Aspergillus mulundensis]RDW87099.1 hypothetical protein DSM5745_03741 [Aspergillus mulundensis]